MSVIIKFDGKYRFLSNFIGGVEQQYQAAKTNDPQRQKAILLTSASEAKKLGRLVTIRKDWDEIKLSIMEKFVREKFNSAPYQEQLLSTGQSVLIEGNYWHDNYWGVCFCAKCPGYGQNHLGELLMKARQDIWNYIHMH